MEMKTTNKQVIEEATWGLYVWRCADGEVLGSAEGIMNVFCVKNDLRAIAALTAEARNFGHPDGTPEFWSGRRRITDEELEEQVARQKLGLIPDPLDVGVYRESRG